MHEAEVLPALCGCYGEVDKQQHYEDCRKLRFLSADVLRNVTPAQPTLDSMCLKSPEQARAVDAYRLLRAYNAAKHGAVTPVPQKIAVGDQGVVLKIRGGEIFTS